MPATADSRIISEEEEDEWIKKFSSEVNAAVAAGRASELDFFFIAEKIQLDLHSLHKEGKLMYTLWVILLLAIKDTFTGTHKYPTLSSFLEAYPSFAGESATEKENLWHSANWMVILFSMITARKNKGLVIQVIPKVVEGWGAKYVTGSGQTLSTARRVLLFETEGQVKKNRRGKSKLEDDAAKAAEAAAASGGSSNSSAKKARKTPTPRSDSSKNDDSTASRNISSSSSYDKGTRGKKRQQQLDNEAAGLVMLSNKRRNGARSVRNSAAEFRVLKGEQLHADVSAARASLSAGAIGGEGGGSEMGMGLGLGRGFSELSRDDSLGLGLDLTRGSSFTLGMDGKPAATERAYSWMEIPTPAGGPPPPPNERGAVTAALATARDSSLALDSMLIRLGENISPAPLSACAGSLGSNISTTAASALDIAIAAAASATTSESAASASASASASFTAPAELTDAPLSQDAIKNMFAGYS